MLETPKKPSNDKLLEAAWQRQQTYSQNASRHQQRFVFLRSLLAFLSVWVVVLAIIEDSQTLSKWENVGDIIDVALLVVPILITGLLAFSVRFDRGQNWILLRGSAESLKREIYYYRTRVKPYDTADRRIVLSQRLKQISGGLKGSPVHHGAMDPYEEEISPYEQTQPKQQAGILLRFFQVIIKSFNRLYESTWDLLFNLEVSSSPKDNKYTDLTESEDYIRYRLEAQFEWYRKQAKYLAQKLQFFQTGIYVFGGIGTLLAAFEGTRSWVAVTTAMVAAFTNYLEVRRTEASLVGYNQAADTLYDIRTWWYALPPKDRQEPAKYSANFKRLVNSCEGTIRSETTSWLQDMQDRLADLYGLGDNDEDMDDKSVADKDSVTDEVASNKDDVNVEPDGKVEAAANENNKESQ